MTLSRHFWWVCVCLQTDASFGVWKRRSELHLKMAMLRVINTAARLSRLQGKFFPRNLWRSGQKLMPAQSLHPAISVVSGRHFHNTPQHLRKLREYDDVFKKSVEDPEEFWGDQGDEIDWFQPYTKVMDNSNPPFTKWWVIFMAHFSDLTTNHSLNRKTGAKGEGFMF